MQSLQKKSVREVVLDSGLLLPLPVVMMLRSIQDFINFVDFGVFFSLGFLFHLTLNSSKCLNGSFMGSGTGKSQTLSGSSHHISKILLTQGLSHRHFVLGDFSHIGLSACLGMHVYVWPRVSGFNLFFSLFLLVTIHTHSYHTSGFDRNHHVHENELGF